MKSRSWYAHGKLLITGEYLVLEGAKALAMPIKPGQYLTLKQHDGDKLFWNAIKPDGLWFQAVFDLPDFKVSKSTDKRLGERLLFILRNTRQMNPGFLRDNSGVEVETTLEFDPEYGFGSSSTLIANIAKWANVDPFELQKLTFGGSGYDIACASLKDPIIYWLDKGKPMFEHVSIDYDFTDRIYFVYLGKKQSSVESIGHFRQRSKVLKRDISEMNDITREFLFCKTIDEFEKLVVQHEVLMSRLLKMKRVQTTRFPDHKGIAKSLGGWGGDFVLMTRHSGKRDFESYLRKKGYSIFYRFDDLIL